MGLFDDLFVGFLDLNGDRHTDAGEEFIGYLFLNELEREERKRRGFPVNDLDDDIFLH